jgi:hypothetical protein
VDQLINLQNRKSTNEATLNIITKDDSKTESLSILTQLFYVITQLKFENLGKSLNYLIIFILKKF